MNIYVHIKLFWVHSVSKLYKKYPNLDQIDKMIRYNMYSGYKWWSSIRSEPLNEQNWIHLSSIILDTYTSSKPVRSPSLYYKYYFIDKQTGLDVFTAIPFCFLPIPNPCDLWSYWFSYRSSTEGSVPKLLRSPKLTYEVSSEEAESPLADTIKKTRLYYSELYRNTDDFDENIHLVQYWNNHLRNHNNIPHVINCPMLMVKHNDKYLIHLYTNPCKKFVYLSDITQFTNVDSQTRPANLSPPSEHLRCSRVVTPQGGSLTELVVKSLEAPCQKLNWIPSKVRFLNVSYTNPDMSNEIVLEIPDNMFFVGNHLLSATFLLRMLEYTVGSTVSFNMDYKLKIIDSNIQYFEMDSNEYLELELDKYNLKRVV